jgi:hypothetical protein
LVAAAIFASALTALTQLLSHPWRAADAPWKPVIGISGPTQLVVDYAPRSN